MTTQKILSPIDESMLKSWNLYKKYTINPGSTFRSCLVLLAKKLHFRLTSKFPSAIIHPQDLVDPLAALYCMSGWLTQELHNYGALFQNQLGDRKLRKAIARLVIQRDWKGITN